MALQANVAAGDTIDPSWGNTVRDRTVQVTTSGARPGAPTEGMVIYETDTDRLMIYTGAAWQRLATTEAWDVGVWVPTVKFGATAATIVGETHVSRYGRLIVATFAIRCTNLNGGTGTLTITRPTAGVMPSAVTFPNNYAATMGQAGLIDVSAGGLYHHFVSANANTGADFVLRSGASPGVAMTHAAPVAIAVGAAGTGDELHGTLTYEAAA